MQAAIAMTVYALLAFGNIRASQEVATWEEAKRRGTDLQLRGKYIEAETAFREALRIAERYGSSDPRVSASLSNLATLYQDLGRFSEAEKLYRKAIALVERTQGPHSPGLLKLYINLLSLYAENENCGPSAKLARRIAKLEVASTSKDETARRLHAAAATLMTCKRYTEAEPLLTRALSLLDSESSADSSLTTDILNNLGVIHASTGNSAAAVETLLRAIALLEPAVGDKHPALIKPLANLGCAYSTIGRYPDAESTLRRALSIAKPTLGTEHRSYGVLLSNYAVVLRRLKRKNEAIEAETQAKEILKTTDGAHSSGTTVDVSEIVRRR